MILLCWKLKLVFLRLSSIFNKNDYFFLRIFLEFTLTWIIHVTIKHSADPLLILWMVLGVDEAFLLNKLGSYGLVEFISK